MRIFKTSEFEDKYRTVNVSTSCNLFSKCEYCGTEYKDTKEHAIHMHYYHMFGLVLCDRCIDKIHQDDVFWSNEDARKSGLCDYPIKPKPKFIIKNCLELKHIREEKYGKFKEDDEYIDELKMKNIGRE